MVLLLFFYNIVIKVSQFFLLFRIGLGTLIGNWTGKGVCVCMCVCVCLCVCLCVCVCVYIPICYGRRHR